MSAFDYQAAVKITFDKAIVSNPEVVTGTEYYRISRPITAAQVYLGSSDYSGSYPKSNAFDEDIATYWRPSGSVPYYLGKDFGEDVSLTRVGVYLNTSYCPNAYVVQGSADNSNWIDVATGNFTDATGWQYISFAETSYRYWRLKVVSMFDTYLYIYEMRFYGTRNTYNVSGWTVSADKRPRMPDCNATPGTYTVRKVTKTPDNLSVILWLELTDRMRSIGSGDITITYNKILGNLIGPYNAAVEDFTVHATPMMMVQPNPHDSEYVSALMSTTVAVYDVTYYYARSTHEYVSANIDTPTVTVTNVGGLPL